MGGATTKSNPAANKLDNKELVRLRRQDYWIQVTRMKLLMDLIFVCEFIPCLTQSIQRSSSWPRPSIRRLPLEAREGPGTDCGRPSLCGAQVSGVSARTLTLEVLTGGINEALRSCTTSTKTCSANHILTNRFIPMIYPRSLRSYVVADIVPNVVLDRIYWYRRRFNSLRGCMRYMELKCKYYRPPSGNQV